MFNYTVKKIRKINSDVYHIALDASHAHSQFKEIFPWVVEHLPPNCILQLGSVGNDFKIELQTQEQVVEFILRFC